MMKNPKNELFSSFQGSELSKNSFTSVMGGATGKIEDSVDQCTTMPGSGDQPDCQDPSTRYPGDAYATHPPYVDTPN